MISHRLSLRTAAVTAAVLLVGISACASPSVKELKVDSVKELTIDDVPQITKTARCLEKQELFGDPNFYGPAAGLNCVLDDSSAVVLKVFDEPGSTAKVIEDWGVLISDGNQIVYSDSWFATGPPEALQKMFAGYKMKGPQASAPASTAMSEMESNLTFCSSLSYNVIASIVTGTGGEDLKQYYEQFPGLEETASSIAKSAISEGVQQQNLASDDLQLAVFLTKYDQQIKGYCTSQSG